MWGTGPRGNNGACSALYQISVTSPRYPQAKWALLVLIPGWVDCVHSRILWASPVISPVRLGASPAAASTPTGVFNQRFDSLFPHAGTPGCIICLAPQLFLWVYLHMNVGLPAPRAPASLCPPAATLPCPPHSTIHHFTVSASPHLAVSPLRPAAHLRPSYYSG